MVQFWRDYALFRSCGNGRRESLAKAILLAAGERVRLYRVRGSKA